MVQTGDIRRIAIIGAGIMGTGLAAEYAASGRRVTLFARDDEKAARGRANARAALQTLERGGVLAAGAAARAHERIGAATTLEGATAGAELVVESIPEDLALKRDLFARLERTCGPAVIFASNTSGLPITSIAADLAHPERMIGTHYLNPPHLMPPVEVSPGERTAPETVETVRAMLAAMGKAPVIVRREVPGFLWNRIQFALAREAFWLIEHGVATMEEIDLVMEKGLGRRWSIRGPLASLDLGGIDTMAKVAEYLLPELSAATEPPRFLNELIAAGRYGAKTGAGFYDWPEEELRATLARRDELLLGALRKDREEDSPTQRDTPQA